MAAALLLASSSALAACGGAAPASKAYAPGAPGLDEAMADLAANERAIASRFGPLDGDGLREPGGATLDYGQPHPQQGYPVAPYPQQAPTAPTAPGTGEQPLPEPFPGSASPPPPPLRPPAAAPEPLRPSAQEGADEASEEREREDRCALACRSLGAMRRAAEHVCRAAGTDDARCGRARGRVTAAERRVSEACDDC